MTRCTRRQFLVAASAAAALGGPRAPGVASAQTNVKLGTAVLGDYALAGPFIVALDKGYFRAEGLNAEFIPFRGGPDLVKAVIAGDILIGAAGSTDILVAREAGQPLKMSATHTEGNHFTLNVSPEIEKATELKGKAIGVTRVCPTPWGFAPLLAKKEGWDPDTDLPIGAPGGSVPHVAAR